MYNANDDILNWSPPQNEEILDNSNFINVALRITHYIIYITDPQTGLLIARLTTTGPQNYFDSILSYMSSAPCNILIQVSAVNPAGEGQKSTAIEFTRNRKSIILFIA